MRKNVLKVSLAACAALVLLTSVAMAGDNWVGIWKLEVGRSKFSPGPGPKGQMLKFVETKDGTQLISDTINADGTTAHGTYTSHFDGKDVPWTGNPDADTASPTKIDDNSYENVWKKGGKATMTAKVTVSADGKTLTVVQSGTNAKGQAVTNTSVYTRQ
jgi:hypothetical protein